MHGACEPGHWRDGTPIAASGYFTSWALSPAIAYRNGPRLAATLAAMPGDADIFIERLMPAEMATEGGFIADGAIVGRWVMHDDQLSRKQHPDQPRQTALLVKHLDGLLDRMPRWRKPFAAWCGVMPPAFILNWLGQLDTTEREGGRSRHAREIRRIMVESLERRVRSVPGPQVARRRRGKAAL
jgi:hypothetical protein